MSLTEAAVADVLRDTRRHGLEAVLAHAVLSLDSLHNVCVTPDELLDYIMARPALARALRDLCPGGSLPVVSQPPPQTPPQATPPPRPPPEPVVLPRPPSPMEEAPPPSGESVLADIQSTGESLCVYDTARDAQEALVILDRMLLFQVTSGLYHFTSDAREARFFVVAPLRYAAACHEALVAQIKFMYRVGQRIVLPVYTDHKLMYSDGRTAHALFVFALLGDPADIYATTLRGDTSLKPLLL